MCVICYKPAGTKMPSDETVKKMFQKNPHGAGFAIQGNVDNDGKFGVRFYKGFMNIEDLLKALHSRKDMDELTVVIHCRIKTSGETDQYTTHPFKMSSNYNDLRKLEGKGSVLFHNGIFSGLGHLVDKNSSDTQDFVVGVAMKYLKHAKMPSKVGLAVTGQIVGDCRVIILYQNKQCPYIRFGKWTKHTDGCEYSNMLWNTTSNYSSSYGYSYSTDYSKDWNKWGSKNKNVGESTVKKIDEYGCNIAQYAWPNKGNEWVNAGSIERFNQIMKSAKTVDTTMLQKEHYSVCTFTSTGDKKWYAFPDTYDFMTEEGIELFNKKEDLRAAMMEYSADLEDETIGFLDEEEMLEFASRGRRISDYEVVYAGKHWYLDVINIEAYTDKGIEQYFKTGEQGHVKKYLKELGCTNKYLVPNYEQVYEHQKSSNIKGYLESGLEDDYDTINIEETEKIEQEIDEELGLA